MKSRAILLLFVILTMPGVCVAGLFGYDENEKRNLNLFTQWLSVLERHIKDRIPDRIPDQISDQISGGNCEGHNLDQCHVSHWMAFLKSIQNLPDYEQMVRVNNFANKQNYVFDIDNYGVEDYWATPREFLSNHGDCEDYAITKMLSLKILGFDMQGIRLVVLQDTNLRIAHAVLAVDVKTDKQNDTLIMDNQIDEIVSHKYILHYVPVYAVSEKKWWLFLPH